MNTSLFPHLNNSTDELRKTRNGPCGDTDIFPDICTIVWVTEGVGKPIVLAMSQPCSVTLDKISFSMHYLECRITITVRMPIRIECRIRLPSQGQALPGVEMSW